MQPPSKHFTSLLSPYKHEQKLAKGKETPGQLQSVFLPWLYHTRDNGYHVLSEFWLDGRWKADAGIECDSNVS